MIDVTNSWSRTLVLVALFGAVGGFVYELVLERLNNSGMLEKWASVRDDQGQRTYWDIGFVASVVVGAVAAVGFLYFLPPETTTVLSAQPGGDPVVTRLYDPWKLFPVALIVGTGGVSFIKAMRERVLRVITEERNAAAGDGLAKIESALDGASQAVGARQLVAGDDTALKIAEARGALEAVRSVLRGNRAP